MKKWLFKPLLTCLLLGAWIAPGYAQVRYWHEQDDEIQQHMPAESVTVLGQQVLFSNPMGYCTPGDSVREVDLINFTKRFLAEGVRLVHIAVLCSELDDYRMGRREMLDHWLQIQLISPKGNFQRIEMPREAYLSGLSKSIPQVSSAEINRRLKASFENSDVSLTDVKFEPIGRDGNAVYFSMRMNVGTEEGSRSISGISAMTLLNSLPISINVYEGTGSPHSRGQLYAVQQELLNSLLTENLLVPAQTPGYTKINVKGRVQIEVPSDWTINDAEHRKRVKDFGEKVTGMAMNHVASLSAQSYPAPSRVFVRVSFIPMDQPITQEDVRQEVQESKQQVLKDLEELWREESPTLWAGMAKYGMKEVGRTRFAVESIGGQTALVIRYGRTSSVNSAETMRVAQYHVPLGDEKVLITLSYIEGDQQAIAAHNRLKNSIVIR